MKIKGVRRQWVYLTLKCNILSVHRERRAIIIMYLSLSSGASGSWQQTGFQFRVKRRWVWVIFPLRDQERIRGWIWTTFSQRPRACNDVHTTFTTEPKTPTSYGGRYTVHMTYGHRAFYLRAQILWIVRVCLIFVPWTWPICTCILIAKPSNNGS